MLASRRIAVLGRLALVALLCVAVGVALVTLPHAVSSGAAPPSEVTVADLAVAALVVRTPPLAPPATATSSSLLGQPAPAAPQDPLAGWAGRTASLVAVPAPELIADATAELTMRRQVPGCHLSWITVEALGAVAATTGGAAPVGSPQATSAALCGGGRDTATAVGWTSAVGSVVSGVGGLQKVLAIETGYAEALRTGVQISQPARAAIDFAVAQIGLPYVWGGDGPQRGYAGFDCSGLTAAAYASAGVVLPRTAHTQFSGTSRVLSAADLRPGDLVFYGDPSTQVHHVGLYLGNGVMVNAPTFGEPVQVSPYRTPGDDFAGAGRPG